MYLIAGLGNPGKKYNNTWHNLGFNVVDKFVANLGGSFKAGKGEYIFFSGFVNFNKVYMIKPTTYMNNSGRAIVKALDYFKIPPENLLVVYDDIHLEAGRLRFREKGSAGGHNGIKSIISYLKTQNFNRLRVGFKTDIMESILKNDGSKLPDLVLSKMPSSIQSIISKSIDNGIEGIEFFMKNGIEKTMNFYNSK